MKIMGPIISLLTIGLFTGEANAQAWPSRSIRVIVPVAAGSSTDIVPRIVFEQLSQQLGQPIVIENRTGAAGTLGAGFVAKSDPDGYTILAHGSAHTIAPALYKNIAFNTAKDFIAVVPLGISPSVLVVPKAKGHGTVGKFVDAARATPGAMNYSSVGVGTATHLSAERFILSTGIKAVHVPFRGGAEAMNEVIAGRVDFFFGPVALVIQQIREGKLAALAVNGEKRATTLPDVPTTAEAGVPNAEYPIWFGLFLPTNTPASIVEKLHDETTRALQSPKVRDRLNALGVDPMIMTPDEFGAHVMKEIVLNAALVGKLGIKPE